MISQSLLGNYFRGHKMSNREGVHVVTTCRPKSEQVEQGVNVSYAQIDCFQFRTSGF